MRIKQFYSNFGNHFAEAMAKKYGLILNNESIKMDEPLFMFGCYGGKQIWHALTHNSGGQLTVICWAGSDAMNIPGGVFKEFPKIKHIAISKWIAADLGMLAIPCYRIPITPHDFSDIKPEPLGDSIYMYQPDKLTYNGNGIYQKIKEALPDYKFIECKFGDHTREEMIEIYKQCFIGLRFTEHDGLSNTVCELGMMGRMVINNGDIPNCIPYQSKDVEYLVGVITALNNVLRMKPNGTKNVAKKVKDYLNIGDNFLNTEYYEK
jgi:hypothetical protein